MERSEVMGLVAKHLYFGRRPPAGDMAMNGSILNRLNASRGYSWEDLGKMVEGLAVLRERGDLLPTVGRTQPVSLRWVYDSGMIVNQVTRCLDAYAAAGPAPVAAKRGGKAQGIGGLVGDWYSKQAPVGSVEESVQEDAKWEGAERNDEPPEDE